jgi:hypothetical protein
MGDAKAAKVAELDPAALVALAPSLWFVPSGG